MRTKHTHLQESPLFNGEALEQECNDEEPSESEFWLTGRSTYLRIDLDIILHNIRILKERCSPETEVMAVIKANAYGHGSVAVARHLSANGIRHFAVATAAEGQELRQAGIKDFIQVFGNCVGEEVNIMQHFHLTPTVTTEAFLNHWISWRSMNRVNVHFPVPPVVIKVDSGMSRNGCQPEELPKLMAICRKNGVPVHSLMTHFAQAWDDEEFTKCQLDTFLKAAEPYRGTGIKLQAANSAAIIRGFATDLDIVRPGICIYGLPPDLSQEAVQTVQRLGLRPALSWIAHPNMVKVLPPGRHVGYDQTYVLDKEESIATFSVGYADGYSRLLSEKGVLSTSSGQMQSVVGRVSMDAITVRVEPGTSPATPFYVYTDDLTSPNSVTGVARVTNTIPYEVLTSLATRLPRIYVTKGTLATADGQVIELQGLTGETDYKSETISDS